ncbi:unnamed protein product [Owenia fusiformis]|uniref:Death domain-containing protein n=1 Tax=Owenia fusiformis TaxID=6347 RepID=A0A8S4PRS9_OWEFU|nr:unnamed protein product [Owenia fusiformis]
MDINNIFNIGLRNGRPIDKTNLEEQDHRDNQDLGLETAPGISSSNYGDGGLRKKEAKGSDMDCRMVTITQGSHMLQDEIRLHEAAKKNNPATIKKMLEEKVDVNSKNNLDRTPLMWAAAKGHNEIVSILLAAGADMEAEDKYAMRPMLWAAWFGHKDTVRLFINAGADANGYNKLGLNVIHCAASGNNVELMELLHEQLESFDINKVEKNEMTCLHLAAANGHVEMIEKLIELRVDVEAKDKLGQTALHTAAKVGAVAAIEELLKTSIKKDEPDLEGKTALHLAAECGDSHAVDVLLASKLNPNCITSKMMTPLHLAAMKGHTDVCAALLKRGADADAKNYQGNTALHLAVVANYPLVVQTLIDGGCGLDLLNHRQQTALHIGTESGLSDIVDVLLSSGVDLFIKDKTGKTALYIAARGSYIKIVDMIIKAERGFSKKKKELIQNINKGFPSQPSTSSKDNSRQVTPSIDELCSTSDTPKSSRSSAFIPQQSTPTLKLKRNVSFDDLDKDPDERSIALSRISHNTDDIGQDSVDEASTNENKDIPASSESGSCSLYYTSDHNPNEGNNGTDKSIETSDISNENDKSNDVICSEIVPEDTFKHVSDERLCNNNKSEAAESVLGCDSTEPTTETAVSDDGLTEFDSAIDPNEQPSDQVTDYISEKHQLRKQFSTCNHASFHYMNDVLWKLAKKQLRKDEWRKLGSYWEFTDTQILAIQHQYTGEQSWKEHGYRLMLIWLYGIPPEENPMKYLYEGLCAIKRNDIAEMIRRKANADAAKVATGSKCTVM